MPHAAQRRSGSPCLLRVRALDGQDQSPGIDPLPVAQLGARGGVERRAGRRRFQSRVSAGIHGEAAGGASDRAGQAKFAGAVEKQQKAFSG